MKRSRFTPLILAALLALLTILPVQAKTTLKLATVTPDHNAYTKGAQEFSRLVEEATKGEVVIKVFGGGRLGKGERELLEGLQLGTIDIAVTATGPVSNFSEDMGVVDLPFLFTSNEHVDKVLDGPIGRSLLDGIENAGIKGLAFFENGFRNFTNSKRSLIGPQDFKGLKFRTMENPVHLASVRQLGAQAVPMSWGEVYTSLQTGVVQGQTNPAFLVAWMKLNEVQKYLTLANSQYGYQTLICNKGWYDGLSPEDKLIVQDAAEAAKTASRGLAMLLEDKHLRALKEKGMVVDVLTAKEISEFQKVAMPACLDWLKTQMDPKWVDELLMAVEDAEKKLGYR